MIAIAWTTIALIAVLGIIGIYLIGFVVFGLIWRSMRKNVNDFARRWP